jgi:glycosyltransferase involved in cell wall biosynthesis
MRLGIFSPHLPHPAAGGGMSRVHHLMRRLAEHCDVFLFCLAANPGELQIEALLEHVAQLVVVQPQPDSIPISNGPQSSMARHTALAMRRHLEVLIEDWQIPLLEVEGTQLGVAGSWLRQTTTATILAAPELRFGLCGQTRESALLGSSKPTRREEARWRRYELRHLRRFDCIVTASEHDRKLLEKRTSHARVRVVGNGVDFDHFRNDEPSPGQDQVLWIADFERPLDMAAFEMLTREIWPRIREARPHAELTVVAGAGYRLHWRRPFRRSLPATPGVTVLGHVGDLRPLYARAAAVIAPLPAGGSAAPPILEALAMSRAVVATRAACDRSGAESGRHLLLAETPAEFAGAILKLLGDEGLRQQLGRQGRMLVEPAFDWDRSAAQQLEVYEELLRERNTAK